MLLKGFEVENISKKYISIINVKLLSYSGANLESLSSAKLDVNVIAKSLFKNAHFEIQDFLKPRNLKGIFFQFFFESKQLKLNSCFATDLIYILQS